MSFNLHKHIHIELSPLASILLSDINVGYVIVVRYEKNENEHVMKQYKSVSGLVSS